MLNRALGAKRFRQQVYRKFQIDLWMNQPQYPKELLPWNEGSTQVDAVIRWENPPTTIYCEMKYLADLSSATAGGQQQAEFPSDQLIRNIRVGLWRAEWFQQQRLFAVPPRDFSIVVIGPSIGHKLVSRYRNPSNLRAAIPFSDRLVGLPRTPFVGELGYVDIIQVIGHARRWITRPERILTNNLAEYLGYKLARAKPDRSQASSSRQRRFG